MELWERGFNRASKFLLIAITKYKVIKLMRIKWFGLAARIEEIKNLSYLPFSLILGLFLSFFIHYSVSPLIDL